MAVKFELGIRVRDRVVRYTGIIDARAEYLNGCNRYSVQAPIDKEGNIPIGYWFDENILDRVGNSRIEHKPVDTGGPMTIRVR